MRTFAITLACFIALSIASTAHASVRLQWKSTAGGTYIDQEVRASPADFSIPSPYGYYRIISDLSTDDLGTITFQTGGTSGEIQLLIGQGELASGLTTGVSPGCRNFTGGIVTNGHNIKLQVLISGNLSGTLDVNTIAAVDVTGNISASITQNGTTPSTVVDVFHIYSWKFQQSFQHQWKYYY
jgi:hypothetical protein